jgi:hypothetical protein
MSMVFLSVVCMIVGNVVIGLVIGWMVRWLVEETQRSSLRALYERTLVERALEREAEQGWRVVWDWDWEDGAWKKLVVRAEEEERMLVEGTLHEEEEEGRHLPQWFLELVEEYGLVEEQTVKVMGAQVVAVDEEEERAHLATHRSVVEAEEEDQIDEEWAAQYEGSVASIRSSGQVWDHVGKVWCLLRGVNEDTVERDGEVATKQYSVLPQYHELDVELMALMRGLQYLDQMDSVKEEDYKKYEKWVVELEVKAEKVMWRMVAEVCSRVQRLILILREKLEDEASRISVVLDRRYQQLNDEVLVLEEAFLYVVGKQEIRVEDVRRCVDWVEDLEKEVEEIVVVERKKREQLQVEGDLEAVRVQYRKLQEESQYMRVPALQSFAGLFHGVELVVEEESLPAERKLELIGMLLKQMAVIREHNKYSRAALAEWWEEEQKKWEEGQQKREAEQCQVEEALAGVRAKYNALPEECKYLATPTLRGVAGMLHIVELVEEEERGHIPASVLLGLLELPNRQLGVIRKHYESAYRTTEVTQELQEIDINLLF